jgi:hypothetical protein
MWLLTRYGTFWISTADGAATVRAWRLSHLENLRAHFAGLADAKIVTSQREVFRHRLVVSKEQWPGVMMELAEERQSGPDFSFLLPRVAQQKLVAAAFAFALFCLNAYICRDAFSVEYTDAMNSMHGFWIAMAKLANVHWYRPRWWPYWYLGMPFEYTYAPLVPGLTAAIARLSHISAARAFHIVSGGVYCFGPVSLYLMARQLTGRMVWSFIAGVVYSLSAASELVLPDAGYSIRHWGDARRLYLCFVWDEVPHQLGLALVCLAILFFARALEGRKIGSFVWAGLFVSLSIAASAFGASALVLFTACLLATCQTANLKRNLALVALCGVLGYLVICPYVPPSLIAATRANSQLFEHSSWNWLSLAALAVTAGIAALLWFAARRAPWYLRFFLLIAWLGFAIPAMEWKWHVHFIPQPLRYKVELELTLVLLLVFAGAFFIDRLPRAARAVLALVLLGPVTLHVISHRRFGENVLQSADVTKTIEYQVAMWVESNLPGERVFAPGSIAQWLNAFTRVPQLTGGSFPTAPNASQLRLWSELIGYPDPHLSRLWYKAYGVGAVIVAGRNSPEFWQPHPHGHMFDGVLPLVWDERDTQIYAVPRSRTLAHAIPNASLVTAIPASQSDSTQLVRYVAALDAAGADAAFRWLREGRARIHAAMRPGQVLSVQVAYSRGWKATASGRTIPVGKDGLGQIVLEPPAPGNYDIELLYGADREAILCRILSAATLLGVAATVIWGRRRRISAHGSWRIPPAYASKR